MQYRLAGFVEYDCSDYVVLRLLENIVLVQCLAKLAMQLIFYYVHHLLSSFISLIIIPYCVMDILQTQCI